MSTSFLDWIKITYAKSDYFVTMKSGYFVIIGVIVIIDNECVTARRDKRQRDFPKMDISEIPGASIFADEDECQRIHVDECKNIGYNMTKMPPRFGHDRQVDAGLTLKTYLPLIQYGCHDDLQFFLCAVYLPMCVPSVTYSIGGCQNPSYYVDIRK